MSERSHQLLTRQLLRHLGIIEGLEPSLAALVADVSRAYDQADADRALLERSLELTSLELLDRNEELSAAMRQASISIWSWDPTSYEFSIQGYNPVGFEEVRGRAVFPVDALLARIWPADRGAVADLLIGTVADREIDLEFRVGSGRAVRWVHMRGNRDRGGERRIGVWADITAEAEARLAERLRSESMRRQTHTLQRLAAELVVGTDLATVLARACADAGATLDVAWTSVWLLEDDGRILRCAARCAYPSGAPTSGESMITADHPIYLQALGSQRFIAATSVADEPGMVELIRSCAARGVTSLLDSACRSGGVVIGVVCVEHVGEPRQWTPEERSFAASVADGVSLAIEGHRRQRAEAERADLEASLRQAQKMESLGLLAGGVAHDFNNLLTPILMCSEMLRDGVVSADELQESVADIMTAALDARDLVAQLLAFGRRQMLQLRNVDLNEVCERAVKLLTRSLPETIRIELACQPGLDGVHADAGQLQQVVVNLAINARDAMPGGGLLRIATAERRHGGERYGTIVVEDNGAGIEPDLLPHIFEPFFTTKSVGRGTGLGLSTAYGIVNQHRGAIQVVSTIGQGTRFEIRLPFSDRPRVPIAATASLRAAVAPAGCTILVVEDEPSVLSLVARVLRREGYHVLAASRPDVALGLAAAHVGALGLVLTDVVMPEMNGRQLYDAIERLRPGTRVLYMTGYDQEAVTGAVAAPERVLRKPFSLAGLVEAVRDALA